jgi:hypothetical protein
VFVSEGSEGVKTATVTLSFKLNQKDAVIPITCVAWTCVPFAPNDTFLARSPCRPGSPYAFTGRHPVPRVPGHPGPGRGRGAPATPGHGVAPCHRATPVARGSNPVQRPSPHSSRVAGQWLWALVDTSE